MNNGGGGRGRGGFNWRMMYARNRGGGRGNRGDCNSPGGGQRGLRGRGGQGQGRNSPNYDNSENSSGPPVSAGRRTFPAEQERTDSGFGSGVSTAAPPPNKRKKTIKESVINAWKKILPGYSLYYPEAPPQLPDVDKKILIITDYLRRKNYLEEAQLCKFEEKEYFEVICEQVADDVTTMAKWPHFLQDLNDEPAEVVNLWSAVMHKVLLNLF